MTAARPHRRPQASTEPGITFRTRFEHQCHVCGAWGSFGNTATGRIDDAVWYCAEHKDRGGFVKAAET